MNLHGVAAIYKFEMARTFRTLAQSLATPVISTSLYFIVFGAAIGSRLPPIEGVPYGAFIVPGLVLLSILMESVSNASFGIYLPKFAGTIGEILSAPLSAFELVLGYIGAAVTKSLMVAAVTLVVARLFVPYHIDHPVIALAFLLMIAVSFCLFGFLVGLVAKSFDQLQTVPLLILSPLGFLGGSFYTIDMLPEPWATIAMANPIVYLVSAFRWSFYGISDVSVGVSLAATAGFLALCSSILAWVFKTGWRLKA
ncbi:ABC transporter permease [Sphingomonas jatrophae]|uniref:Transport permease protein n=1 Tax=Sphingomonas jatrophae TaxID=1166337 RepID=A0A1I6LP21_9SPHN|nr:ABC transporter permease [Sphingomonas jatrophae]SFS05159.1 ABC-2 type transport system permease protein [Sphingomonas jatrophae]